MSPYPPWATRVCRTPDNQLTRRRRPRRARPPGLCLVRLLFARNGVGELDELGILQRRFAIPCLLDERHRALQASPTCTWGRHRRSQTCLTAVAPAEWRGRHRDRGCRRHRRPWSRGHGGVDGRCASNDLLKGGGDAVRRDWRDNILGWRCWLRRYETLALFRLRVIEFRR